MSIHKYHRGSGPQKPSPKNIWKKALAAVGFILAFWVVNEFLPELATSLIVGRIEKIWDRYFVSAPLFGKIFVFVVVSAVTALLISPFVKKIFPSLDPAFLGPVIKLTTILIFCVLFLTITFLSVPTLQEEGSEGITQDTKDPKKPLDSFGSSKEITPSPTVELKIPFCLGHFGEWPCKIEVPDRGSVDGRYTLAECALTEYHLDPNDQEMVLEYANVICQTNLPMLEHGFNRLTPDQKSLFQNNPCNYLEPGWILLIPIPPITPKKRD
jgi:hypothetical protein